MKEGLMSAKKIILARGEAGAWASLSQIAPKDTALLACCRPEQTADQHRLAFNPAVEPPSLPVSLTPHRVSGQAVLLRRCRLSSFIDQRTWCTKALSSRCSVFQLLRHLLHGSPWLSGHWKLCEVISCQQSKHFTKCTISTLLKAFDLGGSISCSHSCCS